MKTISANLQTHLAGTVTTLACLWQIDRTDGVSEYYTGHDQPIVYDGNTYTPVNAAFSETAITGKGDLAVDNLEVEVILGAVAAEDIRAGIYDFASVYFSLINYKAPADGIVKIRRGWFGEATISGGKAKIELRGMMEALQHPFMEHTSPTCRADFCDDKCGLSLSNYQEDGTAATLLMTDQFSYASGSGLPSGFTHRMDGTGVYNIKANSYSTYPFGGNLLYTEYTNWTDTDPDNMQFLSVDFADGYADTHIIAKIVDDYNKANDFSWGVGCRASEDISGNVTGYFLMMVLDSTIYRAKLYKAVAGTWTLLYDGGANGAGRRDMYFELRVYGSAVKCRHWYAGESRPAAWSFETTDTAVADAGWTGVFNKREISFDYISVGIAGGEASITLDDNLGSTGFFYDVARSEADYWNNGTVEFTGPSSSDLIGFSAEIKTFDPTTKTFTLWEPMPYTIPPGTTYTLTPGCDKTLATCRDVFDNVVNFRGEPHLPGNDALAATPNYSERAR